MSVSGNGQSISQVNNLLVFGTILEPIMSIIFSVVAAFGTWSNACIIRGNNMLYGARSSGVDPVLTLLR
jgi:hypothetical protein